MKCPNILYALSFLLASQSAFAYDSPLTDPAQRALLEASAKEYQHFADDFGCKTFAWGNITATKNSTTTTLKYLPEGATATAWSKMLVVTVYPLTADKKSDQASMAKSIATLEQQYSRFASIISDEKYTTTDGDPMLFLETRLGKGDKAVYASSDFMRTGGASAAFIQFESLGAPVPQEMSQKMKEIVFLQAK